MKRLSDATNVVYCYNRKTCQSEDIVKDKETKINFKGKLDLMEIMYIHSSWKSINQEILHNVIFYLNGR